MFKKLLLAALLLLPIPSYAQHVYTNKDIQQDATTSYREEHILPGDTTVYVNGKQYDVPDHVINMPENEAMCIFYDCKTRDNKTIHFFPIVVREGKSETDQICNTIGIACNYCKCIRGDKSKEVNFQYTETGTFRIEGCQTLQQGLDGVPGTTNATITVDRRGRTNEQVCETLGSGCKACKFLHNN
jgi:hypothetical protein